MDKDGQYESAANLDAFKKVIAINLVGSFDCIRLAATAMSATEPGFDPADLAAISEALGIGDVLEAQRIILRAIEADRPEHLLGGQTVDRVGRCGTCVHWRATHVQPSWGA